MTRIKLRSGHIKDYDVLIVGDVVTVLDRKRVVTQQRITGLTAFITRAKAFKLGWARLPDCEVIYLYDKADGN